MPAAITVVVAALHQNTRSVGELRKRGEILFYSRGQQAVFQRAGNRNLTYMLAFADPVEASTSLQFFQ